MDWRPIPSKRSCSSLNEVQNDDIYFFQLSANYLDLTLTPELYVCLEAMVVVVVVVAVITAVVVHALQRLQVAVYSSAKKNRHHIISNRTSIALLLPYTHHSIAIFDQLTRKLYDSSKLSKLKIEIERIFNSNNFLPACTICAKS